MKLFYLCLLAIGVGLFVLTTKGDVSEESFTIIAASTTTGFQIVDLSTLAPFPKLILTIMMLIEGCGFSTTGGIKIFRLIDFFKMKSFFLRKKWKLASPDTKMNSSQFSP